MRLVHALLAEVDSTGGQSLAKEHMTFFMAAVKALKEHFGKRQLRAAVTH